MRKPNYKSSQFAVCIDNTDNPASLDLCKIYQVLPDDDAEEMNQIRVIDNDGEDYLYPEENFIRIEADEELKKALLQASRLDHSE